MIKHFYNENNVYHIEKKREVQCYEKKNNVSDPVGEDQKIKT